MSWSFLCVSAVLLTDAAGRRIQMELDSRKNEAKADLKRQDISIEVNSSTLVSVHSASSIFSS